MIDIALNLPRIFFVKVPWKAVAGATATAAVAVGLGYGVYKQIPTGGGGGGTAPGFQANIWVDENGGSCVDNTELTSYDSASACNGAGAVAAVDDGDVVGIACSTGVGCVVEPSGFNITSGGSSTNFDTWRGSQTYTVTVGSWDRGTSTMRFVVSGSNNRVENLYAFDMLLSGDTIVARGISGSNFTASGDDIVITGPNSEWTYLPCSPANTNVVAQGPYFVSQQDYVLRSSNMHDNDSTGCSTSSGALHTDCMQVSLSNSTLIERNKMWNCGAGENTIVGDGTSGGGRLDNVVFQNNFLGQTDAQNINTTDNNPCNGSGCGSILHALCTNPLQRNNTMYKGVPTTDYGPGTQFCATTTNTNASSGIPFHNNIIEELHNFFCSASTWQYTIDMETSGLWSGGECGTGAANSTTAALAFVNFNNGDLSPPGDWNIGAGSSAIGFAGAPCPITDIRGYIRDDGDCDAGASEYDTTPTMGPTWYVDDAGSDDKPCTEFFPCLTLNRAYQLAAPGDVIGVMSGTYASQTITADKSKSYSTNDVVIQPAPGATVELGTSTATPGLTINGASHLTVKGMAIDEFEITTGVDITLDTIDNDVFTILECTDCVLQNSDIGPYESHSRSGIEDNQIGTLHGGDPCQGNTAPAGNATTCPQNIVNLTITGNFFHDFENLTNNEGESPHLDCLQFYEGQNVDITRNTFDDNCGDADDMFIRGDGGPVDDFLIENNFSYRNDANFSIRLSGNSCPMNDASSCVPPCNNVRVWNNTVRTIVGANCTTTNSTFRGNINLPGTHSGAEVAYICDSNDNDPQGHYGTEAGWAYQVNIVGSGGTTCSGTDIASSVTFVSSTTNLDLSGSNGAADNALPSPFAAVDIHGLARPANTSNAEIGADERNQ